MFLTSNLAQIVIEEDNKNVQIVVKYNRIGLNIIKKIFQSSFVAKAMGRYKLGLSLSYKIFKAHGGELQVESTEGKGSVFTLILPIA